MHITIFADEQMQEKSLDDLPTLLAAADSLVWVDLTGPGEADIAVMRDVFRFHPLAIEDTHNQRQRPKVEAYADYLFVILNTITVIEQAFVFEEFNVFLGTHYLVTVHAAASPLIEEARQRVTRAPRLLAASADHLFYLLLDTIVDSFFPVLDTMEEEVDRLGDLIMAHPDRELLNTLFQRKRDLAGIWRVVWPQRDVLNNLAHHRAAYLEQGDLRYYLRDVSDHLLWIADMVTTLRDTLTSMMDLYMSASSNRLNVVVNRLTVFTVTIGILTVISGFYGMNFAQTWPPFEAGWAVPLVVALMALLAGGLLVILRRLRWY